MKDTLLVTGGSGFVGSALTSLLVDKQYHVRTASRRIHGSMASGSNIQHIQFNLDRVGGACKRMLQNVDVVIHLAARVHVQDEYPPAVAQYRQTNIEGTQHLAELSASAGVRRFIFLSTVKVHGETTPVHKNGEFRPFRESDALHPDDPYAISKLEAESAIMDICKKTDMEYVILRPPLVYGPRVKANFYRLLNLVAKGYPLPFSLLTNKRSMLYVRNLADAIRVCIDHPQAANQTFLVKDIDITLPALVGKIGFYLDRPARLVPVPVKLLKLAGVLTNRASTIERLTESLLLDDSHIKKRLGWTPPFSFEEGLRDTVEWYRSSVRNG